MKRVINMTKYIIKDWAGNVMNNGTLFDHIDDASEWIDEVVRQGLKEEGIDLEKTSYLEGEYPDLNNILDKIVAEYRNEYYIDEIEEDIDLDICYFTGQYKATRPWYDGGCDSCETNCGDPIGYGNTKEAAIEDLLIQEEERSSL